MNDLPDSLFQKEEFRPLKSGEERKAPLYCSGCKRLLAEAEVYDFRRQIVTSVKCWCGAQDRPLAKQDHRQTARGNRRSRAIMIASRKLPGGKDKTTVALLSIFLGWIGVHKFYLDERLNGLFCVLWCWTFIPLIVSVYEGVSILGMSLVTFNMSYNFDLVLQELEKEESRLPETSSIFAEVRDVTGQQDL